LRTSLVPAGRIRCGGVVEVFSGGLAVSPVPASVTQPRPFGYVVGDLLEQRVLLQANRHGLVPASLPRPGRVSVWLERRGVRIASDAQGRHWLIVEYQLINAPQGLTT